MKPEYPELDIKIVNLPVTKHTRKLSSKWTIAPIEPPGDFKPQEFVTYDGYNGKGLILKVHDLTIDVLWGDGFVRTHLIADFEAYELSCLSYHNMDTVGELVQMMADEVDKDIIKDMLSSI